MKSNNKKISSKKLLPRVKTGVKILVLAIVLTLSKETIAGMASDNYRIWVDTFDAAGGATNTSGFKINSNLSDFNATQSQSSNFSQKIAFSGILDEPTVGFNVQSVTLDFGLLSTNSTKYAVHTFSAFTNAQEGYTIKIYGDPLKSNDYIIQEIGTTASAPTLGTEQFGINLMLNSTPSAGANPTGGIGQAAVNYNQANKFAYHAGETIAYAESYSYQTDYTVTAIVNIADDTPAGAYTTILTYEFIPVF
ncbi:MAG: hypothetical protein NTZ49_03370 [Candidatus Parcubacteria bacterium]|nr:hypothetical protein [Candidatus Parcubacteria bacterium]